MDEQIEALRAALELTPGNHVLRRVLADALRDSGDVAGALEQYGEVLAAGELPDDELVPVGRLALGEGKLTLSARCLEAARRRGVVGGTAELEELLTAALADTGTMRRVMDDPDDDEADEVYLTGTLVETLDRVTFADVGGLDEVKKAIHRTIILPFQRPDLYEKYGRSAGGGILLYGPPGCGKTLLARATAGECGLPFINLRIEDVLNEFQGVSERRLHDAFEQARAMAPCVLFIDEIDAFGYARHKQQGSAGRALVDQLLQELDAIGADNRGLLVLSATNAPWDLDDALKRPGRFDRVVFVPPPDEKARRAIIDIALQDRPTTDIPVKELASKTALSSGADLISLVEHAVDRAIDETLDTGGDVPINAGHFRASLGDVRPTTLDWLRTARNYVEFANSGGRYDDVDDYLGRKDVKRALASRKSSSPPDPKFD